MSEIFANRPIREVFYISREFIFANWAVWKIPRELIFANWEEKFLNLCIFLFQLVTNYTKFIFVDQKIFFVGIKFRDFRANSQKSQNFLPAKISDIKVVLVLIGLKNYFYRLLQMHQKRNYWRNLRVSVKMDKTWGKKLWKDIRTVKEIFSWYSFTKQS